MQGAHITHVRVLHVTITERALAWARTVTQNAPQDGFASTLIDHDGTPTLIPSGVGPRPVPFNPG